MTVIPPLLPPSCLPASHLPLHTHCLSLPTPSASRPLLFTTTTTSPATFYLIDGVTLYYLPVLPLYTHAPPHTPQETTLPACPVPSITWALHFGVPGAKAGEDDWRKGLPLSFFFPLLFHTHFHMKISIRDTPRR